MVVLIAAYLGMTLAYHYVLPMDEIKAASGDAAHFEKAVAALYCDRLLGWWGVLGISLLVMCSTFIALNGNALAGPRAYFAMARDGLFPAALCRVHPQVPDAGQRDHLPGDLGHPPDRRGHVPDHGAADRPSRACPDWSCAAWRKLNETPLYDVLYTYVIFGAHIFYMLAIASVFVLRVRRPDLPRPYRTLGYPVTPLLFVAAGAAPAGQHALRPAEPRPVAGRPGDRPGRRAGLCLLPAVVGEARKLARCIDHLQTFAHCGSNPSHECANCLDILQSGSGCNPADRP